MFKFLVWWVIFDNQIFILCYYSQTHKLLVKHNYILTTATGFGFHKQAACKKDETFSIHLV